MKEIKAYIRRHLVNRVIEALQKAGAPGITVVEVHPVGYGYNPNYFEAHSFSAAERYAHWDVVKLEAVCADEELEELIQVVQKYSRTGVKGDGRIFVSEVFDALRIRDGMRGSEAL
jgi:nitrogen regulatory protein P-II 1